MPEKIIAAPAAEEVETDIEKEDIDEGKEVLEEEQKSPYQEELDRIEAEAKEREDKLQAELEAERAERAKQVELKDRALEREKAKTRDIKEEWKTEAKTEALSEFERKLELRDARSHVQGMTDDPTAQKVILHHFENLPASLKTGDIKEDMLTAMAIANRKRFASLMNEDRMEDLATEKSISSMGSSTSSGSSFKTSSSAAARAATRLTQAYAGQDKDKAKKLSDRVSGRLR